MSMADEVDETLKVTGQLLTKVCHSAYFAYQSYKNDPSVTLISLETQNCRKDC